MITAVLSVSVHLTHLLAAAGGRLSVTPNASAPGWPPSRESWGADVYLAAAQP